MGILENDQVYAVALGEHGGGGGGSDGGGEDGGAGWGPGGHGSRGKKGSRAGEGKVTHGGRTTATQPLLPHGGEWQQQQRDGGDRPDADGGGSGSGSLVQSWSTKGTPPNGELSLLSSLLRARVGWVTRMSFLPPTRMFVVGRVAFCFPRFCVVSVLDMAAPECRAPTFQVDFCIYLFFVSFRSF